MFMNYQIIDWIQHKFSEHQGTGLILGTAAFGGALIGAGLAQNGGFGKWSLSVKNVSLNKRWYSCFESFLYRGIRKIHRPFKSQNQYYKLVIKKELVMHLLSFVFDTRNGHFYHNLWIDYEFLDAFVVKKMTFHSSWITVWFCIKIKVSFGR